MAKTKTSPVSSSRVRLPGGLAGFRALPKSKGKRPGVILLHERYGVLKHTRDLAIKLAEAGYIGFAPDLFWRFTGDKKALERGDVRSELRDSEVIEDIDHSIDYLRKLDSVEPTRIGIIGVCQTGRHALLPAAHREDLSACVVFYGAAGGKEWSTDEYRPETIEALLQKLCCPLLGVFGEADHIISVDDVLKFRGALEQSKKNYHIRIYRDAPHGWLNDTMPGRYREAAAKDAWKLLLSFLKRSFGGGWDESRVVWRFESDFSMSYDYKKNVRLE